MSPQRVAIGHSCCLDDPSAEVIKQIAQRGAFVGFNRVTGGLVPDDRKVAMILAFLDAGHVDRLLLSADYNFTARSAARPGYGITLTVFVPKLRQAGVTDDMIRRITIDNPRRFLAFVPVLARQFTWVDVVTAHRGTEALRIRNFSGSMRAVGRARQTRRPQAFGWQMGPGSSYTSRMKPFSARMALICSSRPGVRRSRGMRARRPTSSASITRRIRRAVSPAPSTRQWR